MAIYKTMAGQGEELVAVVKFDPKKRRCTDTINYTDESIIAVIPCWKNGNSFESVKTGLPIAVKEKDDDVRTLFRGTALCYEDGTQVVWGMNFRLGKCEFIERTKGQGCTLKCFGE